jgi:hypothetical protein
MSIPKVKAMCLTTYQDANPYQELVTERSMSGILHFVNQTPISWFSINHKTVETTTYGFEFVVERQARNQIIALHTIFMIGIPLDGPTWMFGDNASVITSSTIPNTSICYI